MFQRRRRRKPRSEDDDEDDDDDIDGSEDDDEVVPSSEAQSGPSELTDQEDAEQSGSEVERDLGRGARSRAKVSFRCKGRRTRGR